MAELENKAMDKLADRAVWLEEHSASEYDVRADDDGMEYIVSVEENGTAGDDGYAVDQNRTYLPVELY